MVSMNMPVRLNQQYSGEGSPAYHRGGSDAGHCTFNAGGNEYTNSLYPVEIYFVIKERRI